MNSHPSALITGASTGIGEACARYLVERGWRVFAGVRQPADAERLAATNITPLILDVTQAEQIDAAMAAIRKELGGAGLQGLVNNAGIAVTGPLEYLPLDDLRLQMEVNFISQVAVTQASLPLLRLGRGRIANISSIGGRVASPFVGPYSASKFALEAFTDALRRELRPWKMHVASIQPGSIKTPIWEKSLAGGDSLLASLPAQAIALYGPVLQRVYRRAQFAGARGIPAEAVARAVHHALSARWPRTRYIMGRGTRTAIWFARRLPDELVDWVFGRAISR
jgi:NAD(P)-dependent dehydrogenase (short-subunit alcohol dehydrogenase family)